MSINEFNKPWVIQEGIRPWVLHLGDSLPGSNAMFERLCFFQRRGGDQVVFAVSVCSKCRDLHSLDVDCWQVWHLLQTKRTMSQRGELERCAERFAMYWYFANANGIFVSTNIFPLSTSVLSLVCMSYHVLHGLGDLIGDHDRLSRHRSRACRWPAFVGVPWLSWGQYLQQRQRGMQTKGNAIRLWIVPAGIIGSSETE